MSDQRDGGISWTDETWNPIRGCSRVSAGCDACYAMRQAHRFAGPGQPYEGLTVLRPKDAKRPGVDWTGRATFVPEMLGEPFKWRKPQRVFVDSMSDLFHESIPIEQIAEVFGVMAVAAQPFGGKYRAGRGWIKRSGPHTFQVLTKRAKRARDVLQSPRFRQLVASAAYRHAMDRVDAGWLQQCVSGVREWGNHCKLDEMWPLPNVWIGVSAENQETADERIPELLALQAAVRFVSAEPLLGPLDLTRWLGRFCERCGERLDANQTRCDDEGAAGASTHFVCGGAPRRGLDWVIVGGESGHGARPFDLGWARSLVAECAAAGVACFVKQMGADPIDGLAGCSVPFASKKGGDISEWPEELRVQQFPEVADG